MQKSGEHSSIDEAAPRGRGRPRAFDREAALGKATLLFWKKGFEATSIAELTEAMGIGAPSLYAAFGSKEALYCESLRHYRDNNEAFVWAGFFAAPTAREAVRSFLMDSAAGLTGRVADIPHGCMVALSSVADRPDLDALLRATRAVTLERLQARIAEAITDGEMPASTDAPALARFVQTVQNGMSILARDGAGREELEAVAELTMLGWDASVGS